MKKLFLIYIGLLTIVRIFGEEIPWETTEEYASRRAMASDYFWDSMLDQIITENTLGTYFLRPFVKLEKQEDYSPYLKYILIDENMGLFVIGLFHDYGGMEYIRRSFIVQLDTRFLPAKIARVESIELINHYTDERYEKITDLYDIFKAIVGTSKNGTDYGAINNLFIQDD